MSWELGIDFGTSYTVAAASTSGVAAVVDMESSGRARIPSAVYLTEDDEILVGTAAQHQAVFDPSRYEPTPKRSLGEGDLFLGDRLIPVSDLVAAVLRRVYTEACRQQGERAPAVVRITHPADWSEARLGLFREAIQKAGLQDVALVPEPVAAVARIALATTTPGQYVAVYDFGGGTFDAAVLLRTDEHFEVAGPPAGRDPLGGEDIDQRIVTYLGELLADAHPAEWDKLTNPPDVSWRRDASGFRGEVQRAKETLSEVTACQMWVPGINIDVQLTRPELEKMIAPDVEATVDALESALGDANVKPQDLAGIFLVGGSSRIPLVADRIWRRLDVRPAVQDNPKSVVALGAAAWTSGVASSGATATTGPLPSAATTAPGVAASGLSFDSGLAMSLDPGSWMGGYDCVALLVIDHLEAPPATLRARDEPAGGATADALAARALSFRSQRSPGFAEQSLQPANVLGTSAGLERRFTMQSGGGPVAMIEHYAVVGERAFVVACPEAGRACLEALTLREPRMAPAGYFESRWRIALPDRWSAYEHITLRRRGSNQAVIAERVGGIGDEQLEAWRRHELDVMTKRRSATIVGQVRSKILNALEGDVYTLQWAENGIPMFTKFGVTIANGEGYSMAITLPHADQAMFPGLARHAVLSSG